MDLRCIKKSFIKEDLLKMRDYVNSSDLERKSNERNKI